MEVNILEIGCDKPSADISQKLMIKDFDEEEVYEMYNLTKKCSFIITNLKGQLLTWLSDIHKAQPRLFAVTNDRLYLPPGAIPKKLLKKHKHEYLWKNDKSCAYIVEQAQEDIILGDTFYTGIDEYAVIAEVKKQNSKLIDRYIIYSTR